MTEAVIDKEREIQGNRLFCVGQRLRREAAKEVLPVSLRIIGMSKIDTDRGS
jgi:hypothetical protein